MRHAWVVLLCSGCFNPGALGSARTLDRGEHQFVFAPEWVELRGFEHGAVPVLQLGYRRGLAEDLELGLQGAPFPYAGADLKWQFADAGFGAAALIPAVAYVYTMTGDAEHVLAGRLTVIGQLDLHDDVAFLASAGAAVLAGPPDEERAHLLVGGVGVRLRIEEQLALQPGVSVVRVVEETLDPQLELISFGLAITVGDHAH